jgi:hypothetical protein
MKPLLICSAFVLLSLSSFSQSMAKDFTAADCAGATHNLFSELNEGKVVVLVWVMPCAVCIGPAVAAHNLVQTYSGSFPGKVVFYLADDFGTTNCNTLGTWAAANGITDVTLFSKSVIKMSDYGENGMPKGIVLGGTNHAVFFNEKDEFNMSAMKLAIDAALAVGGSSTTAISEIPSDRITNVFPNPSGGLIEAIYHSEGSETIRVDFFDVTGKTVSESQMVEMIPGNNSIILAPGSLPGGIYFLRTQSKYGTASRRIVLRSD